MYTYIYLYVHIRALLRLPCYIWSGSFSCIVWYTYKSPASQEHNDIGSRAELYVRPVSWGHSVAPRALMRQAPMGLALVGPPGPSWAGP